ncbi:MAG TPA: RNA 2',3'-cyclic phosphodiesterase, partial [bacterium]|nr:RNA 2',3'-cyclic phosphodiesterase [bacterium]
MNTLRLFAALDLPAGIRESWKGILDGDALPQGVRWVRPGDLHVTLRFFGELGADKEPGVGDLLAKAAARHRPFSISLRGLGAFPPAGKTRVVFLGVEEGRQALAALAQEIAKSAGLFGWGTPGEFQAHVTLGRVGNADSARVPDLLRAWAAGGFGPWKVDAFSLYQSRL